MIRTTLTIGAIALSLLAAVPARADQLADIKARGKLICATQGASEPFGFPDPQTREIVGYDVDFCKAIAKGLGVELEHKAVSTEARIPELNLKRIDILVAALGYSSGRATQVDYSDQYYVSNQKVLVRSGAGPATLVAFKDKKIAAVKGSSSAAVVSRVLRDTTLLAFQDIASCYLALQQGKVSGMVAGELILARFAKQSQGTGEPVEMMAEPLFVERWGVGVRKGEPALLEAINKVLHDMDASGEVQTIFDRWIGAKSPNGLARSFKVEPIPAE
jgi:polar amino acid transport system substrate-binding protein